MPASWLDDGGGPILKVHEYHNNPIHQWSYSTVPGTGDGGGSNVHVRDPYITHWALDGSLIRVRKALNTSGAELKVRRYYNPDSLGTYYVEKDEDDVVSPDDDVVFPPVAGPSGVTPWAPLGYHVYDDNSKEAVWSGSNSGASPPFSIGNSTFDPRYGSTGVSYSGPAHITATRNFAYDAGIPAAEIGIIAAISQDGRTIIICTRVGGTVTDRPTKWYKIRNGLVVDTGTVLSGLNLVRGYPQSLLGYGGSGLSASFQVGVLENNGRYWWGATANNQLQPTTSGPAFQGIGTGIVTLFWINDSNELGWLSNGWAKSLTGNPLESGIQYPACCSPAEGFFGLHMGSNLGLFARRPLLVDEPRIFIATP